MMALIAVIGAQAQLAGVLRDLCISDEIAMEIEEAGGVDAIIEAARRHYDSTDVQVAARTQSLDLTLTLILTITLLASHC